MSRRHNFKWSINETLRLQREFELLNLTISDIAKLHERSENAILYKLFLEGFITDINSLARRDNNSEKDEEQEETS